MDRTADVIAARDGDGFVRFVAPFDIDIPALKRRIANGGDTAEAFVDVLMPGIRDSILVGVEKELARGRNGN